MFATLGSITFELLASPFAYASAYHWSYAEQLVVEARPQLQWISEALQTISLDLRFHASFTDPAAQLSGLLALADGHAAQALYWVMVSIRATSLLSHCTPSTL